MSIFIRQQWQRPRPLLYGLAVTVTLAIHSVAHADPDEIYASAALSDKIYYQIGGANVSTRPSSRANTFGIGVGGTWQGMQMCTDIRLTGTFKNQLNGLTEGFRTLGDEIVAAGTGALMSAPLIMLKRQNPDLYDFLTGGMFQARADFDRGLINCQRIVEAAENALGNGGWQQAATTTTWEAAIEETGGDAVASQQQANREAGNHGLSWVEGEKRGGRGQAPISVIRDTMVAGYNILNGRRSASSTEALSSSSCTGELCRNWPSPEDAAKFMTRIVGEQQIRTCNGCEKSNTTAGVGLMPIIQEEQEQIYETLQDLASGSLEPTPENLAKASGGSMRTSRSLVEALQKDPDQEVLIQRLSAEMALVRVLEKTISASRALHAGMREPNIANVNEAIAANDRSLDMLEREINLIKMELDLRNSIANNTAMAILERRASRQEASRPVDVYDPTINRPGQADKPRTVQ
ncbi:integrating conjugative element protein [Pseudomonas lopnurensis]|uniref:integrating conjugative element protein n=1 Tax=Pseudomonas lopnurensis TaxID=1477517 RepID=UPI0028A86D8C|nr:integrating conjugative element protein [Pseudomonas lopnurensis]